LNYCSEKNEIDWVAKVGDVVISQKEYQSRLNFSSFLKDLKDEERIKKVALSSLLAEKLFAEEAMNNNYQNDMLTLMVDQNQRELMIEYIRKDSVDDQITVSQEELSLEFKRKTRELDVKYIAIADLETAIKLREQIESGQTFEETALEYIDQMGWHGQSIPTKRIKYHADQPEMEIELYKLDLGSTSNPLKAFGEFYLVKIDNIERVKTMSDFDKMIPKLTEAVRARKIKEKYKDYYTLKIYPGLPNVNWELLENVVDKYISTLSYPENPSLQQNILPENGQFDSDETIATLKKVKVAQFSNYQWTIEELFQKLRYGPYAFNLEDKASLKKSFFYNIKLLLEHEVWYSLAKKLQYDKDARVKEEHSVWKSYYYAKYFRDNIRQEGSSDNKSDTDLYISKLSDKYKIELNKKLYQRSRYLGQDIFLQKQHFANRSVTPPLLAVGDYSHWKSKMDVLFEEVLFN